MREIIKKHAMAPLALKTWLWRSSLFVGTRRALSARGRRLVISRFAAFGQRTRCPYIEAISRQLILAGQLLIKLEEACHTFALGHGDGEAVGGHNGAVILLMRFAQLGRHGEFVVKVGKT